MSHRILIVDDEPLVRRAIRRYLERKGFEIFEAPTVQMGAAAFRAERPDAVILDYELPDGDALDLLQELEPRVSGIPVVVLTGHGSIDLAVQCMKQGAESFLTKPAELQTLTEILQRALESRRHERRAIAAERAPRAQGEANPFVGSTPALAILEEEAMLALDSNSPVLVLGETGCGKGMLARWLHTHGPRASEAFVDLNCAGLSRELLESELFGHARGAFTGAVADKPGLMEVAHRGTLFLDEIGDMELQVQPKFLTALEEQRFRRLGDVSDRRVDVRLIAATHRDLALRVREGSFRADLYYRINTVVLEVPPLRDRLDDLEALAEVLLQRLATEMGRPPVELTPGAATALKQHAWPGNIRELRNVLERALLASRGAAIESDHLRLEAAAADPGAPPPPTAETTLEAVESRHIQEVLRREKGQVGQAAERLGVPRSTLYQKLKTFGIDPARFRG